jgi:hypothetical protein
MKEVLTAALGRTRRYVGEKVGKWRGEMGEGRGI